MNTTMIKLTEKKDTKRAITWLKKNIPKIDASNCKYNGVCR